MPRAHLMAGAATNMPPPSMPPSPCMSNPVRPHHCRRRPAAAAAHAHAERERGRGAEAHRSARGRPRARKMEEDCGVGNLDSLPASERKLKHRVLDKILEWERGKYIEPICTGRCLNEPSVQMH